MGELAQFLAHQALSQPRLFNSFPGKAWGRKVKWFDIKSGLFISSKEAEGQFSSGTTVGYVAKGFTYAVRYDSSGREPAREAYELHGIPVRLVIH